MQLTFEDKQALAKKHGSNDKDFGTSEVQIAMFTKRIAHLTEHLRENNKDHHNRRALIRLVGKRRRLLDYLKKKHIDRYRAIIKELKIRK